jgi:hypothetical protein
VVQALSLAADLSKTDPLRRHLESDAFPEEFRRELEERAGFWPGRADFAVFGAQSEHPEIYMEQSDRLTEFLTKADLAALGRPDWDLLLLYQSEVDAVEHEFLLTETRQEAYTPERAARYAAFIDHAFADADRAIERFLAVLTPADALFVTADHGMTPLHTELYPAELLVENGFTKVRGEGGIDPPPPHFILCGGPRRGNKPAPAGTLDGWKLLAAFRVQGESPYRVVRREAAESSRSTPGVRDLILPAKPGYHLDGMRPAVSSTVRGIWRPRIPRGLPAFDATFLAADPESNLTRRNVLDPSRPGSPLRWDASAQRRATMRSPWLPGR